jgi:hypothetical protein
MNYNEPKKEGIMKNILPVLVLTLGLFTTPALALVDIGGILQTGNAGVDIDSIQWYLVSSPAPILESTPGWGGPAGTTDTYQLAPKTEWPQWGELYYRVNGIPNRLVLNPILPDTWYELSGFDLQGAMVRFEDTVLQGINTPPAPNRPQTISVFPNPVRAGLIRLEPVVMQVELYDIIGNRCPVQLTRDQSGVTLDISRLDCGIYLLRIRNAGFESTTKILKLQ